MVSRGTHPFTTSEKVRLGAGRLPGSPYTCRKFLAAWGCLYSRTPCFFLGQQRDTTLRRCHRCTEVALRAGELRLEYLKRTPICVVHGLCAFSVHSSEGWLGPSPSPVRDGSPASHTFWKGNRKPLRPQPGPCSSSLLPPHLVPVNP